MGRGFGSFLFLFMEETKSKKRISSRNKGNTYERRLVKIFKELGFEGCTTSRLSSKALDDAKVDLYGLPLNVQAKAVEKLGCIHTILSSMPSDNKINVVFHKKNHKGTVCILTEADFLSILRFMIEKGGL